MRFGDEPTVENAGTFVPENGWHSHALPARARRDFFLVCFCEDEGRNEVEKKAHNVSVLFPVTKEPFFVRRPAPNKFSLGI